MYFFFIVLHILLIFWISCWKYCNFYTPNLSPFLLLNDCEKVVGLSFLVSNRNNSFGQLNDRARNLHLEKYLSMIQISFVNKIRGNSILLKIICIVKHAFLNMKRIFRTNFIKKDRQAYDAILHTSQLMLRN